MSDVIDIADTIEAKSNQLNAIDLIGGSITITITNVAKVQGEQPVLLNYSGDGGKPYLPCKSMRRIMAAAWSKYANEWIGRSLTLYNDPEVMYAGQKVGGIRISHMSHIDKPFTAALTINSKKKAPFTVQPLGTDAPQTVSPDDKKKAASDKADAIIKALQEGDLDVLQREAKVIARLKDAYSDLHDKILAAIPDEEIDI